MYFLVLLENDDDLKFHYLVSALLILVSHFPLAGSQEVSLPGLRLNYQRSPQVAPEMRRRIY